MVVVNVKKLVGLIAIALLLFFVLTQPTSAANSLQNILGMLRDGANSVVSFVQQVVS